MRLPTHVVYHHRDRVILAYTWSEDAARAFACVVPNHTYTKMTLFERIRSLWA